MTDRCNPHSPDYEGPVLTMWRNGQTDLTPLPRKMLTWRKRFGSHVWLVQAVCNIGMVQNDRVYPIALCTCFDYAKRLARLYHNAVLDGMYAVSAVHVSRIARSEAPYFNTVQTSEGEAAEEQPAQKPVMPEVPCWMTWRMKAPAIQPPKLPLDQPFRLQAPA